MTQCEVAGPAATGVDPRRLDVLLRRVRQAVDETPLPSMQLAVARHRKLAAFETFGDATGRDRYVLQSVGRSIVAGVVWHLLGRGLLDLRERVAEIVPGFGTNGKDTVTVEHVLTHTAGFPFAPLGYPKMLDREQRLAAFARWRLDSPPGTRFQFHLTSAAWLIGEIVHRRTGLTFAEYLRAELTGPLGLSSLDLGVPADTVLPMIATDRTGDDQEPDPWGPWYLADSRVLAAGEPSHALVGTAADVALFFQALVHSGRWTADAVAEGARIRFTERPAGEEAYGGGTPVSMGLFVTVASGGLPSRGLPALFGNSGAAYQLGFLDPVSGVSFALLCNGYPLAGYDLSERGRAMMRAIADLAADLT